MQIRLENHAAGKPQAEWFSATTKLAKKWWMSSSLTLEQGNFVYPVWWVLTWKTLGDAKNLNDSLVSHGYAQDKELLTLAHIKPGSKTTIVELAEALWLWPLLNNKDRIRRWYSQIISIRLEAIAIRLRPSLLGWRPLLLGRIACNHHEVKSQVPVAVSKSFETNNAHGPGGWSQR